MDLPIIPGEHGRVVRFDFTGIVTSFDGTEVELKVMPLEQEPRVLSSVAGLIVIELPVVLAVLIDDEMFGTLKAGTAIEWYVLKNGTRQRIAAGRALIAANGQMLTYSRPVASAVMGPPGVEYRGAWEEFVTYQKRDAVTHAGSTFYALRQTNETPSADAADWAVLLDGGAVTGVLAQAQALHDDMQFMVEATVGRLDFSNPRQSGWL
ncbi:hypothetical protein [Ancylobacter defluvii]|uniref:Uncharacterized protein n=1 Tax=Ancylobacter defluvii TaxID=1282440 RepID=A0A9W6NBM4_9HYPH|nr:hypothetical protein [Ancylobacter defluvii]MBS7586393.1 hypothetical protein [Ancylobacter defluvii]GLK85674.1 hypothetical protein GCM10017653_37440 [Ancylobacter defluvii]